jgi:WD40 repeat protein
MGLYQAYSRTKANEQPHDSPILTFSEQSTAIDAAWSPDGTRVAATEWSYSGASAPLSAGVTVQVRDATTGNKLLTCVLEDTRSGLAPLGVVWSADGKQLLAFVGPYGILTPGSRLADSVQVWDAATGRRVRSFPVTPLATATASGEWGGQPPVTAWAFNAQYLALAKATAAPRADTRVSPSPTPSPLPTPSPVPPTPVLSLPDIVEIWDLATGSKIATLPPGPPSAPNKVALMGWAPGSGTLAVALRDQATRIWQIWDAPAGRQLGQDMPITTQSNEVLAWSPSGRSVALGTAIYDVAPGHREATYTVEGRVIAQAWSPNGARIAVRTFSRAGLYALTYGAIFIIDAASGKQIARYDEGEIDPSATGFGSDGTGI